MSSIYAKDVKEVYSEAYIQALAGESVEMNAPLLGIFSRILARQVTLDENTGAITQSNGFEGLSKAFTFVATPVDQRPATPDDYLEADINNAHVSAQDEANIVFSQISASLLSKIFIKSYQGISEVPNRSLIANLLSLESYQPASNTWRLIANGYNDDIAQFALETDEILNDELSWNDGFFTMHSNNEPVRELDAQQRRKVIVDSLDTATVRLPSNTLLNESGEPFIILNQGPGAVTIEDHAGNALGSNNGLLQANMCQWYYLASRESGGSWLVLGPFDINF